MDKIRSRDNRHFKFALRVRAGREKELIFVEGARLVSEALRSGLEITEAFFGNSFLEGPQNRALVLGAAERAPAAHSLPDRLFENLADTKNPQGAIVTCVRPSSTLRSVEDRIENADTALPIVVLLHRINNPGNLGAILRTAEAAGAAAVITTADSADAFSPASLRSSMGSAFRLKIVEKRNYRECVEWATGRGLITTCADSRGEVDFRGVDWQRKRLLVLGSEAHGLQVDEVAILDQSIRISLKNGVESLNLAVSAGIILFEALRRHETDSKPASP